MTWPVQTDTHKPHLPFLAPPIGASRVSKPAAAPALFVMPAQASRFPVPTIAFVYLNGSFDPSIHAAYIAASFSLFTQVLCFCFCCEIERYDTQIRHSSVSHQFAHHVRR